MRRVRPVNPAGSLPGSRWFNRTGRPACFKPRDVRALPIRSAARGRRRLATPRERASPRHRFQPLWRPFERRSIAGHDDPRPRDAPRCNRPLRRAARRAGDPGLPEVALAAQGATPRLRASAAPRRRLLLAARSDAGDWRRPSGGDAGRAVALRRLPRGRPATRPAAGRAARRLHPPPAPPSPSRAVLRHHPATDLLDDAHLARVISHTRVACLAPAAAAQFLPPKHFRRPRRLWLCPPHLRR